MRARGEDVTEAFLTALQVVALVAAPAAVLLSGAAQPFTRVVLGERWIDIAGPLLALGLWGAVRPIHATTGWLLNSIGKPGLLARVSAATLAVMLPSLVVAAKMSGLEAVAWVMLAEMVVASVVLACLIARHAGVSLRRQWRALRPVFLAAASAWLVTYLTAEATADLAPALGLLASLAAGALAYAGALRLVEPGLMAQVLGHVRRLAPRHRADGTTP
jgi:O-antigen/teichoic acid export membrane protein